VLSKLNDTVLSKLNEIGQIHLLPHIHFSQWVHNTSLILNLSVLFPGDRRAPEIH
jgi:hypothetical protein